MTNKYILFIAILCSIALSIGFISGSPINITSPSNNAYFSTTPVILNWSVLDTVNITNYTYICGYILGTNNAIIDCSNKSNGTLSVYGSQNMNNLTFYVNRTLTSNNNISTEEKSYFIFNLDSVVPTITISFPIASGYYNTVNIPSNLSYIANDINLLSCWFSNGNGVNVTNACNATVLSTMVNMSLINGSNTWTIYAKDTLNNTASSSVTFTYDPVNPLMRTGPNYTLYNHDAKVSFDFNEDVQAVMWYWTNTSARNLTLNITSWDHDLDFDMNDLTNNTIYFFNITVMDRAINRVYYGPYNFTFNTTNPIVVPVHSSCNTTAICGAWGACTAMGLQSRTCNPVNISCGYSTPPIYTQTCNYSIQTTVPLTTPAPEANLTNSSKATWGGLSDNGKYALITLAIIIIIGIGIAMFLRFRNPEYNDIPNEQYNPQNTPPYNPDDYLGDNA